MSFGPRPIRGLLASVPARDDSLQPRERLCAVFKFEPSEPDSSAVAASLESPASASFESAADVIVSVTGRSDSWST
jgi:hypothetical protein